MTRAFDTFFIRAAALFFCDQVSGQVIVDWPWFKAQAFVESSMDPMARSSKGAMGLMQLMPDTVTLMAKKLQCQGDPYDPRWNITAGVRYCRHLWNIFQDEQGQERLRFVLGAYNAGPGNIIKAQRKTDRTDIWQAVSAALHQVTGPKNSLQTIHYVRKVEAARLAILED